MHMGAFNLLQVGIIMECGHSKQGVSLALETLGVWVQVTLA